MHGMKTRDRNKHVVSALLKKGACMAEAKEDSVEVVKASHKACPSDSVRKSKATDYKPVFGSEIVGRKVAVFVAKDSEWPRGKILGYSESQRTHLVRYDKGGVSVSLHLMKERFQFLTLAKPGSQPNASYYDAPKGKEAIGHKVKVYWPAMRRWYVGRVKDFQRTTGKHLIAYQDGEQIEVHLRNEAVIYPQLQGTKAAKLKQHQRNSGKGGSPSNLDKHRRASHRGKRVLAAGCDNSDRMAVEGDMTEESVGAASHSGGKRRKLSAIEKRHKGGKRNGTRSSARSGKRGAVQEPDVVSIESRPMVVTTDSEDDSLLHVVSPKTPPDNETTCCSLDHSQDVEAFSAGGKSEEHMSQSSRDLAMDNSSVQEDGEGQIVCKVEIAKMKAVKARELATKKAEEAAKALAAARSAQKAEEKSPGGIPRGEQAVGWRVGVWSPEEHKYFKGRVVAFVKGAEGGKHKIQYDHGKVASVSLKLVKVKWLSKPSSQQQLGQRPHQGSAVLSGSSKSQLSKDLVGKYVSVLRGGEKLYGEVIALSPTRGRYLILFHAESKHEWTDMRKGSWEVCCGSFKVPTAPTPVGNAAVGWHVSVYFPSDEKFHPGEVTTFDASTGQHAVRYDDGKQERLWLCRTGTTSDKQELAKAKWISPTSVRSLKSLMSGGSSGKSHHVARKGSHVGNGHGSGVGGLDHNSEVLEDADAVDIMSVCPEVFALGSAPSLPGEKLDVLSNMHNWHGLSPSLEEASATAHRSHKGNQNHPFQNASTGPTVYGVEDAWGVRVVDSPSSNGSSSGKTQPAAGAPEGSGDESDSCDTYMHNRLALRHRLQALEFMLEHSSHAATDSCLLSKDGLYSTDSVMATLTEKVDIQPLLRVPSSGIGKDADPSLLLNDNDLSMDGGVTNCWKSS